MKKILLMTVLLALISGTAQLLSTEIEKKELTLKDAIYLALKNNLDIQVQKAVAEQSRLSLKMNRTIYLPTLSSSYRYNKSTAPSTNIYDGVDTLDNTTLTWNVGISQLMPLGGTLSLLLTNRETETNSVSTRWNPSIITYGGFAFSQPLLKNFGTLATNYNIKISRTDYQIRQHSLDENVVATVYNVESAYWELVYAYQNLEAAQMALQRAKDNLKLNEIKKKVGTIPPIDVLESRANVASNESRVIQAERTLQTREENLKRILNMSRESSIILPLDKAEINPISLDFDSFLKEAMENRPEMKRAKLNLNNYDIRVKYYRNQVLPTLNFTFDFYSYGQAGTFYNTPSYVSPFDPEWYRIKVFESGFSDSFSDIFKLNNKNYTLAFNLEIPIPLERERAQLALSKVQQKQATLEYQNAENTIYSELKESIKEVETNQKLVEADNLTLALQQENLKAEEKRLSVGLSTNFMVLEYQRRVADAQTQALRSTIDFMLSVARLNRYLNRTFKIYQINFSDVIGNK